MITLILSKSLDLSICMMTLCGVVTSGRILVGYVYASEFLTKKWRILFGSLLISIDGSTSLWAAIYFDWINKHAIYFELIGICIAIGCLILHAIFIPESPIWLLKNGRTQEG